MWRRIQAEGREWEVRVVTEPESESAGTGRDILEFRPLDGTAQPRRAAIERDGLPGLEDEDLHKLLRSARPIGGDYYGRPGKTMRDIQN